MSEKLKSDGGSDCPYYMITLPKEVLTVNEDGSVTFQVKDVGHYALGNDFDKINIFKAMVRDGKKEGTDVEYDLKKIKHTAGEMLDRYYYTKDETSKIATEEKPGGITFTRAEMEESVRQVRARSKD